jgi:tetratricopeptide (TPR) repeat protein
MLFEMETKLDKSLASFNKSLTINPNLPDTHNHIARILQKLGKFKQSKTHSKTAVKLDDNFNQAKTTLEQTILNEVTHKPHKVFCIGFNRTGSTSMGDVFKILEYNVKGEVKKQEEWMGEKELESIKKFILSISEDYNAFYHEPWNQFYKELDLKYPDSKFILTIRDEHSWLKSFNNYFKDSGNNNWTPFLLGNYNVKDISDTTKNNKYFTSKFKEHNQSVIDYFKDTPEKLLVMNIFNGDDWDKLCPFLGYDINNLNNTPFPHSNKGLYFPT